jgi:predicted ATP-grasp superfamily ATP-dependent carboligase
LFAWLKQQGCADIIAPTRTIRAIAEVKEAAMELGGKCVIKPALKPLSMQLTGMPAKAFMTEDYPDQEALEQGLAAAWGISEHWIMQPHLTTPSIGEAVFWGVRDEQGGLIGMGAVERWKQPRNGGTGCWVMTRNDLTESLRPLASRILEAIDFVGICELPFLLDSEKRWQLLELNPRPWLQVGLAHTAGAPLELIVAKVLQGQEVQPITPRDQVAWVNLERLLMAAWSGEQGPRWNALRKAFQVWRNAETVAIYDSSLPHIRSRWLMRLAGKVWTRLRA